MIHGNVEDINMLLNCDIETMNVGTILVKKGAVNPFIYFIMTGIVEMIQSESSRRNILSAGSLVGEFTGIPEVSSLETYMAASYIRALKIPGDRINHRIYTCSMRGNYSLVKKTRQLKQLSPGGVAGEEMILYNVPAVFDISATKKSKVFHIPKDVLVDIPIVQWKLMETLEKRLEMSGSSLSVMGEYTI